MYDICISPNPFSSVLNISKINANYKKLYFKFHNSMGELNKYIVCDQSNFIIETNSLDEGVYIYSLSDQNNLKLNSGKLIKNNF